MIKCYSSKLKHRKENHDQNCSWKICQNKISINMPFWTLFCIHTLAAILIFKMAARVGKKYRSRNFKSSSIEKHQAFDLNISLIFLPLCPSVVKMPLWLLDVKSYDIFLIFFFFLPANKLHPLKKQFTFFTSSVNHP